MKKIKVLALMGVLLFNANNSYSAEAEVRSEKPRLMTRLFVAGLAILAAPADAFKMEAKSPVYLISNGQSGDLCSLFHAGNTQNPAYNVD